MNQNYSDCKVKAKIDVEKSGSRYIIPSFMSIFPFNAAEAEATRIRMSHTSLLDLKI